MLPAFCISADFLTGNCRILVPINITDLTLEGEERVPVSSPSTDTPKSLTAEEVEEFEKEQKKKNKKKSSDDESSGSY